jgi:hypothetical protein
MLQSAEGLSSRGFRSIGPARSGWVAMVGHDADTYGAAAGLLIAAAHPSLPSGITD